ncbi:hypothetical protein GM676_00390 [Duganella radicis]|uniref:Uncharacterized protein n=1 Tax=Duganella radicis TaxID=551988 RepID=A0A6L6PBT9_9BURK|nr:hypothetical protein [Duganella radicis]
MLANQSTGAAPLAAAVPPAQAQRAILDAVRQIAPQREERRRYRMALPFGAPLFPPDADLAAPPQPPSPALAAWLALPAAQRRHDLLLTPDIDYYWPAEGRQYSCQFIIHIAAQGTGAQLTLLQVRPTEYAGKHFQLLGRTGPGRYVKLLPTAPSTSSETELRTFLATALARQQ